MPRLTIYSNRRLSLCDLIRFDWVRMIKLKIDNYAQEVSSDSWHDGLNFVHRYRGVLASVIVVIYPGYKLHLASIYVRHIIYWIVTTYISMSFAIFIWESLNRRNQSIKDWINFVMSLFDSWYLTIDSYKLYENRFNSEVTRLSFNLISIR